MRYFVGIDLHSDSNYTGVIDKKDSRIFRKKLLNDFAVILKELEPFRKEIQGIVAESTYNWYWLVDGLQEAKHKAHPFPVPPAYSVTVSINYSAPLHLVR